MKEECAETNRKSVFIIPIWCWAFYTPFAGPLLCNSLVNCRARLIKINAAVLTCIRTRALKPTARTRRVSRRRRVVIGREWQSEGHVEFGDGCGGRRLLSRSGRIITTEQRTGCLNNPPVPWRSRMCIIYVLFIIVVDIIVIITITFRSFRLGVILYTLT